MPTVICDTKDYNIFFTLDETKEINTKIKQFVNGLKVPKQSLDHYQEKRRVVKSASSKDISLGKKGEFFSAAAIKELFNIFTDVDLNIYPSKQKNWNPDLSDGNYNFYVKTCDENTVDYCRDYSWLFQYGNSNGRGGQDAIFQKKDCDKDFVILVYTKSHESSNGIIKAILPLNIIKKLFKNPKKEELLGIKLAIYYKDLAAIEQPKSSA